MSTLKGISPVHLRLCINAMTAYLSVLQGGYTLQDLGHEDLLPAVTPEYALFRVNDEDLVEAGAVLRATIDRLGLRTITFDQALILLSARLAAMRKAVAQMPLDVDVD